MNSRIGRVRTILQQEGLDAALISNSFNRRYLTGFRAMETTLGATAGHVLVTPQSAFLLTNPIHYEQAKAEARGVEVLLYRKEAFALIVETARRAGVKRLAFEPDSLTVTSFRALEKAAGDDVEPVPLGDSLERLRATKDAEETGFIRRAVEIADQAIAQVTAGLEEGITEQELAWRLEKAVREMGAESVAFDLVVAAGPNGALPHAIPSPRPIAAGEPVVIDMGARVEGYNSDLTRTICIGEPGERFRQVYGIVLGAQLAAEKAIRAGQTADEADAFARRVIDDAGYGENFDHSLGHGVGLAVHEYPRVGKESEAILEEGMVITVEPGIYIAGWGGVRIEDTVIVQENGVEVLTKAPKEVFSG